MENEEIERLIADLRSMMNGLGFAWAAIEAEETLYPTVAPRTRALALIAAAEGVTVDLAEVELRALDIFGADSIEFEPDDADEQEGGADRLQPDPREEGEAGRVVQRRSALVELAAQRSAFDALRRRINGD